MKYTEDNRKKNKANVTVIAALCSFAAIIFVLFLAITVNYDNLRKTGSADESEIKDTPGSISVIKESDADEGVRVDDLSFFKDKENQPDTGTGKNEDASQKKDEISEATDGKHTLVKYSDGTSEWISISPYLPKCEYDLMNLASSNGKMKYYENNQCVSFLGVDISEEQSYVDFNKLKKAGVSFVMLKVGSKGNGNNKLTEDSYFADNLKRATDAGLSIGLYFVSEATTEKEAKAEAESVALLAGDYLIEYPVAFILNNEAEKTAKLGRNERTKIAKAFCRIIKEKGFIPMIYGDKALLIKYYDPSKLSDYDIWLSQTDTDIPDYPYRFKIWQYTLIGSIDGIAGKANMNISFKDYSAD